MTTVRKGMVIAGTYLALGLITPAQALTTLQLGDKYDVLLSGATDYADLGTSLATGDFNKDGKADMAIGSPKENSPRGTLDVGAVTVYFGGSGMSALSDIITPDGTHEGTVLYGTVTEERVGGVVAAADFNGDGYTDLVAVGQKSATGNYGNTKVHVVYGKATFARSMTSASADATFQRSTMYVSSLATGDLNGDGLADLAIADILNGNVYVIYGSTAKWSGTLDPAVKANATVSRTSDPDLFFAGGAVNQLQGSAMGDLNGDGIADLAIGVPLEDISTLGLTDTGMIYVFYGSRTLPATLTVENANVKIQGAVNKDEAGGSLSIGKINGDNYADLLIGAPRSGLGKTSTTGVGRVWAVFGSASLARSLDLYSDANVTLQMTDGVGEIGYYTGQGLTTGDLNGDGIRDIVIGTPGARFSSSVNGWVHVVYGKAGLASHYNLDTDANLAILAPDPVHLLAGGRFGSTVAVADFNGDGKRDLVAGAPDGATNGIDTGYAAILWSPGAALTQPAVYNPATKIVTLPEVIVSGKSYAVTMRLIADPAGMSFEVSGLTQITPKLSNPATVSGNPMVLSIPEVLVGTTRYRAQMVFVPTTPGRYVFRLTGATPL